MTTLSASVILLAVLTVLYLLLRDRFLIYRGRPRVEDEYGFAAAEGYSFHLGHTWVSKQSSDTARVGLDGFAARVLGDITAIEVTHPNRWIRQGQRLMTVTSSAGSFALLSPVEGVVLHVNQDVLRDPALLNRDPFGKGWVASINSPELAVNLKNLLQGPMVRPWIDDSIQRLRAAVAQADPSLAQDGGRPIKGFLTQLAPELRAKLVSEILCN